MFKDGFEDVGNTGDLFASSRWTGSQRQPEANRVEISTERSRTGERSVRFEAQPYDGETASKADLILNRLDLREGDPVWVEFWVWVEGGGDTRDRFVWDLEAPGTCTDETSCPAPGTGSICSTPGRRLYLGGPSGRAFTSDLGKWCRGDTFRAASETFETERWVRIRVFMSLSSTEAGQLRVWQDDQTVIDATGITLPRADAVYSQMQVGITANGSRSSANVLFLDDVSIWTEDPLWDAPATGVR
ncbi:MAG: heparin lyase I family protein [Bacteroidota bacterium]